MSFAARTRRFATAPLRGPQSKTPLLTMPPEILRAGAQIGMGIKLQLVSVVAGKPQDLRAGFLKALGLDQHTPLIIHRPQAAIKGPVAVA